MENQVHMPIDASLHARIQAASESRHIDEQELLRRALDVLDRDETYEGELAEDEARWQEYLQTGVAIPHEEVEAWMDTEIAALSAQLDPPQ